MAEQVVTILNWVLAFVMWLVIGRVVLDWLAHGRQTVIGRLFSLLTDPLFRPWRRLLPMASPFAIAALTVLVLLLLRAALVLILAASR